MSNYALLSNDMASVLKAPVSIDPQIYANWQQQNNPKASFYRPIADVAQPSYDPMTQMVNVTGWTITPTEVRPVWTVSALPAEDQTALASQQLYDQLMATNVVSTLTTAINNWAGLSAAQKDNILLILVKTTRAILKARFGVNN